MSAFVFVGPTLPVAQAQRILDATYLPPVIQGDVFRVVASTDARVIAIVDGNFQDVPSVWHKELLWAMSQDVHVVGAGSMGALRAAELADFGMVGIGRVFEAYRSGVLAPYDAPFEDDDEVAVVHAPAELDHRPLSEALVDIRCTLDHGARAGVISSALRDRLVGLAKACFYAERSYEALIDRARADGVPSPALNRLREWLPDGRFSQKQEDAIAMLAAIGAGDVAVRKRVDFDFAHTTMWDRLTVEALMRPAGTYRTALTPENRAVLAEARLHPDEFFAVKESAERALRIGPCPPVWRLARAMLDLLRQQGRYAALAARAARKQAALATAPPPRGVDGLQALQLLDWYFGRRLAKEIPDDVDAFAQSLGYAARKEFLHALLQEYAFVGSAECLQKG